VETVNPLALRVVAEDHLFETLQGEGILTGMPSLFLRTAGCDLRCARDLVTGRGWFCDTPRSLPDFDVSLNQFRSRPTRFGKDADVLDLVKRICALAPRYLVITGGEPTLQAGSLVYLLAELAPCHPVHVTLETNGRHFDHALARRVDLVSLSPKVYQPDAVDLTAVEAWAQAIHDVQVKIVICDGADRAEIDSALRIFDGVRKVNQGALLFVQQACDTMDSIQAQRLREWVISDPEARRMGIRYGQQLHKLIGVP